MPELTSRYNRFSLRSLFVAVTVIAIFTAWWFRPYQIDEKWSNNSSIRMQYMLQRDVYGRLVHVGPTNLVDTKSDAIIATAKTDGLLHDSIGLWWRQGGIYEYRRIDGTKLNFVEWCFHHFDGVEHANPVEIGG